MIAKIRFNRESQISKDVKVIPTLNKKDSKILEPRLE
jgi:hypothetical protein